MGFPVNAHRQRSLSSIHDSDGSSTSVDEFDGFLGDLAVDDLIAA